MMLERLDASDSILAKCQSHFCIPLAGLKASGAEGRLWNTETPALKQQSGG